MRQTISDQPLWLKLVSPELKSPGKRAVEPFATAGQGVPRAQRGIAPIGEEAGMKVGGPVRVEKKERLRKRGVATGGPIDLDYLDPGAYTGDEGETVLADKPVNTKTFKDHEGEYYINAPMTNILGGPEAVEQMIVEAAKRRIAGAGVNKFNRTLKPIMAQEEAGMDRIPVSEVNSSFMAGGGVGYQRAQPPIDGFAGGAGVGAFGPLQTTAEDPEDKGDLLAQKSSASGKTDEQLTRERLSNEGAGGQSMTPAQQATYNADREASAARRDWNQAEAIAKAVKPFDTGMNTSAGAGDIQTGLQQLRTTARGENPVVDNLLAQTLQKHGADTAAGKAELQMRLSQSGVTGPAADAAMESYDRESRIGTREFQTAAAQEKAQQAQTAAGQLLGAGQSERSFAYNKAIDEKNFKLRKDTGAMDVALKAKDYGAYAAAAKEAYGIDIDPAALANANNLQDYTDGMGGLTDAYATFGNALKPEDALPALAKMWTGSGKTGQPTAEWMNATVESMKTRLSPTFQTLNGMSDADLNTMFGTDNVTKWTGVFGDAKGKTGREAFKVDLTHELATGGLSLGANGLLTISTDKKKWGPIAKMMNGSLGQDNVAMAPDKIATFNSAAVGSTFDLNGSTATKTSATTATADGENWTFDGNSWSKETKDQTTIGSGTTQTVGGTDYMTNKDIDDNTILVDAEGNVFTYDGTDKVVIPQGTSASTGLGVLQAQGGKAAYDGEIIKYQDQDVIYDSPTTGHIGEGSDVVKVTISADGEAKPVGLYTDKSGYLTFGGNPTSGASMLKILPSQKLTQTSPVYAKSEADGNLYIVDPKTGLPTKFSSTSTVSGNGEQALSTLLSSGLGAGAAQAALNADPTSNVAFNAVMNNYDGRLASKPTSITFSTRSATSGGYLTDDSGAAGHMADTSRANYYGLTSNVISPIHGVVQTGTWTDMENYKNKLIANPDNYGDWGTRLRSIYDAETNILDQYIAKVANAIYPDAGPNKDALIASLKVKTGYQGILDARANVGK